MKNRNNMSTPSALFIITLSIITIIGWVNHVVVCIAQAKYLLLVAGAICFPIGTCHGLGNLMGFFG